MSDLTIRKANDTDFPMIAEMGARTFTPAGADEAQIQASIQGWLWYATSPYYTVENSWLGMVDGQIAAHVGFVERTLRYGRAEIPFGGIVAVMTRPTFRKQGYAAQVMRAALDDIARRDMPLAILDGIPRYYDRFGFVKLWDIYSLYFDVKEALTVAPDDSGYRVRAFQLDDVPAILALYNDEWQSRPWSVTRSAEQMTFEFRRPERMTWVVEDRGGAVRGYSTGRVLQDRTEVVVADQAAAAALLRHTGEQLADQPDQTVHWLDCPNTRAARYVRRLCSVRYQRKAAYRGDWMGRFIYPQRVLDLLRPELVARLYALNVPGADEAIFTAEGEADADPITMQVGRLCITLPQSIFLQLAFGFFAPEDIDDLLSATVDDAARDLLKRLFPPVMNGFAGLDWF